MAATWLLTPPPPPLQVGFFQSKKQHPFHHTLFYKNHNISNNSVCVCVSNRRIVYCNYNNNNNYKEDTTSDSNKPETSALQLYTEIERVLTETVVQSQIGSGSSGDWTQVEGAWILKPRNTTPRAIVRFVGGIFVGAAPRSPIDYF